MAGSPVWKVYAGGKYIAACKHAEDAAAVVAAHGDGTTIRYQHGLVCWNEGAEEESAGMSYDVVADTCHKRLAEQRQKLSQHA